ncbi:putative pectinesterase inhibitor domain-containing protein [Helianthus annuus]|nr:putative pectinesterase inhibitor domain-containing protein [Helianthus annuus]
MVSFSSFFPFLPLMILTISCTQNPNLLANGDTSLIQKTCQTTKYYDLCISSLQSDSTSQQADTKGLAIILAKLALANATSTNSFLSSNVFVKNPNDTVMKKVLKQCEDRYSAARMSLQNSIQDLESELYDYAYMHVMAASDYANSCRNAFKRNPNLVYPPEIDHREKGLKQFCDVVMEIIDSIEY